MELLLVLKLFLVMELLLVVSGTALLSDGTNYNSSLIPMQVSVALQGEYSVVINHMVQDREGLAPTLALTVPHGSRSCVHGAGG